MANWSSSPVSTFLRLMPETELRHWRIAAAQTFLKKFLDVSKESRFAAPTNPIASPKNNAR
jgi:hypothetical protein